MAAKRRKSNMCKFRWSSKIN